MLVVLNEEHYLQVTLLNICSDICSDCEIFFSDFLLEMES